MVRRRRTAGGGAGPQDAGSPAILNPVAEAIAGVQAVLAVRAGEPAAP